MKVQRIEKGVKEGFSKVRDEMNEHLDAINQNTSELAVAHQYIHALELKLEKLQERIDELSFQANTRKEVTPYSIDLNLREQEVFLALYMSAEPLCINEIAKQLGLTNDLVSVYINKLLLKGIPLVRKVVNELTFFALENDFKSIQARKNIVPLNETVVSQFS